MLWFAETDLSDLSLEKIDRRKAETLDSALWPLLTCFILPCQKHEVARIAVEQRLGEKLWVYYGLRLDQDLGEGWHTKTLRENLNSY